MFYGGNLELLHSTKSEFEGHCYQSGHLGVGYQQLQVCSSVLRAV